MRKWLKALRQNKGVSQQSVAKDLGITQQYYNLIENGERQKRLDLTIAQKLSQIFGVTVDWIIEQENKIA